jgi:hypothetical protein
MLNNKYLTKFIIILFLTIADIVYVNIFWINIIGGNRDEKPLS